MRPWLFLLYFFMGGVFALSMRAGWRWYVAAILVTAAVNIAITKYVHHRDGWRE